MKKWLIGCASALVLYGAGSAAQAQQVDTSACNGRSVYSVQPDDTTWNLARIYRSNPEQWRAIVQENPFLADRVHPMANGGVRVLIYPGEVLCGLDETLNPQGPRNFLEEPIVMGSTPTATNVPWWAWIVGGILASVGLGVLSYFLLARLSRRAEEREHRQLTADPANSGPPMVSGGVNAEQARTRFEAMGVIQHFDILETVPGHASGLVTVAYADGTSQPRILDNERAFRARVRFADRHEEELYMLQRCGNDLRVGGVQRYHPGHDFRFIPVVGEEAIPAPQPQPAAELAPVSTQPGDEVEETLPEGHVRFVFNKSRGGQPHLVRLDGLDVQTATVEVGPNSLTLRYRDEVTRPAA